jgi:integrase
MRGDGSIYQRGKMWWICYWRDGKRYREPGGDNKTVAKNRLKEVRREIMAGTFLSPQQRAVTVDDLLDDLAVHLKNKGAASSSKASSHMKALRVQLGSFRATSLNTSDVERYQAARLEAGKARATVNRECELLRQAYRRASRVTPPKVNAVPYVPMLKVENARQGFLSRADFGALAAQLPDVDVRDFVEWFWWTGMRPGEIRQLTWEMLDRETPTSSTDGKRTTTWALHLDPKAAKTRKGRSIAITEGGPLREIIDRRLARRRFDCTLIFHRTSKGKVGQPVKDFAKQWRAALRAAKLPGGLVPYDLRRTALRNMVRGGTDYTVAMKISGHRTRSTFDRYNITSLEDVAAAMTRTAAYVAELPTERNVADLEPPQNRHIQGVAVAVSPRK